MTCMRAARVSSGISPDHMKFKDQFDGLLKNADGIVLKNIFLRLFSSIRASLFHIFSASIRPVYL